MASMKIQRSSGLLLGLLLLFACGSQASPEYIGKALLELEGSVEIVESKADGPLHPALAFRTRVPTGSKLHFMDVDTTGEFPSDFTLRVMEPPSQDVIDAERERYEQGNDRRPPFPHAYLTAVTDDLPDVIDAEPSESAGFGCQPDEMCGLHTTWCLNSSYDWWDGEDCYSEFSECPEDVLWRDECTYVSSEGNPDVRDYPWKRLAGLSEELRIIYLPEALDDDDPVAIEFDLPALDAGYHALEVIGPSEEELEDAAACQVAIKETVIAEYNAEHGTDYTHDDLVLCGSDFNTPAACSEEMADLVSEIIYLIAEGDDGRTREQVLAEQLDCTATAATHRRVMTADELEHVSVRIAPDVSPSNAGRHTW
jgi:hypothetical protein